MEGSYLMRDGTIQVLSNYTKLMAKEQEQHLRAGNLTIHEKITYLTKLYSQEYGIKESWKIKKLI